MDDKIENIDAVVNFWLDSSEQDYKTMHNLFSSKDYSWSLFIGHLVLEKLVKAIYTKKLQKHAIFTHDLLRLATKANLDLPENYDEWLDGITTFNINARYDNYKQDFHKLCTAEFAKNWIDKIETIRKWLISQL